jgi:hypothetical protein
MQTLASPSRSSGIWEPSFSGSLANSSWHVSRVFPPATPRLAKTIQHSSSSTTPAPLLLRIRVEALTEFQQRGEGND